MEDGDSVISEAAEKHPEEYEEKQICHVIKNLFLPSTPFKEIELSFKKEQQFIVCRYETLRKKYSSSH